MAEPNVDALKWLMKLAGAVPKLYEKLQQWRGQPSREDRERLLRYCRRLDERRVFSAPFNQEVDAACLASLEQVKSYTDEALSEVEHPAAQAAVGAILDEVRGFIDKWHGFRLHHRHWDMPPFGPRGSDGMKDFFQDLGELRGKMRIFVGILTALVPEARAPRLLDDGPHGGGRRRDL